MKNLLAITLLLALPFPTQAEITFEFNYSLSTHFQDASEGPERRAAFEAAARGLGSYFENTATLAVDVVSFSDPGANFIATAGSEGIDVDINFFGFIGEVAHVKAIQGSDENGAAADGEVSVNFGVDWDLDDEVAADAVDFKATIVHELMHLMGLQSSIEQNGSDNFGTPPGDPGVWVPFDKHLTDSIGKPIIATNYSLDRARWLSASTGGASPGSGLFFGGPAARAANGGQAIGLYSPSPWQQGSSTSHLDDDNPQLAGLVMLAGSDFGPYSRELSPIELGILTDLGYSLVPEPELALRVAIDANTNTLTLVGPPGDYVIQESTDMENWSSGSLVRLVGRLPGTLTLTATSDQRFIRAALAPTKAAQRVEEDSRSRKRYWR